MSCSKCSNNQNNYLSECQIASYNFANKQNAIYDQKNNEILYGRSNLMQPSGVSDGTCNQINPMMLRYGARCGLGSAGGNPCFPDTIEPVRTYKGNKIFNNGTENLNFDTYEPFQQNNNQSCNIGGFVTILFLILILLLFINVNYYENKE
jgi:hypothetical protein